VEQTNLPASIQVRTNSNRHKTAQNTHQPMHEVERDLFDRFDHPDDKNVKELRRLAGRKQAEREENLKRRMERRKESQDFDDDIHIGKERRREHGKDCKGTIANLADSEQPRSRPAFIGDLKLAANQRHERKSWLLASRKPVDVVCVDGSKSADKALSQAFKSLPQNHLILLLHGYYSPSSIPMSPEESREIGQLEDRYMGLCENYGRKCEFVTFPYSSNRDFGERVCKYERYPNVESIIMGRRGYVSNLRRTMLGSSSQSVIDSCTMPVTMVNEKERDW